MTAARRAPRHGVRAWTYADDVTLREAWAAEVSVREIARHLRRPKGSIYSRARTLGLHAARARVRETENGG